MRRQHRLDSRPVRCAYASEPTSRPHCQLSAVVRYGPIALCADCDARRSTLGKGITPHRLPWSELAERQQALGRFDDAVEAVWMALDAGWNGEPDGRCHGQAVWRLRLARRCP